MIGGRGEAAISIDKNASLTESQSGLRAVASAAWQALVQAQFYHLGHHRIAPWPDRPSMRLWGAGRESLPPACRFTPAVGPPVVVRFLGKPDHDRGLSRP